MIKRTNVLFRKELRRNAARLFWNFMSTEALYVDRINQLDIRGITVWKHDNIFHYHSFKAARQNLTSSYVYLDSLNRLVNMQDKHHNRLIKDYKETLEQSIKQTGMSIKQTQSLLNKG